MIWKHALVMFITFSGGIVIAGAVFAFIASIGIVPRMAQKTKTTRHIKLYENMITIGGIWGATTLCIHYYLPIGKVAVVLFSLAVGIFYGSLAVSLAEIIDVIPVFTRNVSIKHGIPIFITVIALGKLVGSFISFFCPTFYY